MLSFFSWLDFRICIKSKSPSLRSRILGHWKQVGLPEAWRDSKEGGSGHSRETQVIPEIVSGMKIDQNTGGYNKTKNLF